MDTDTLLLHAERPLVITAKVGADDFPSAKISIRARRDLPTLRLGDMRRPRAPAAKADEVDGASCLAAAPTDDREGAWPSFEEAYEDTAEAALGRGAHAVVRRARRRADGLEVAVKCTEGCATEEVGRCLRAEYLLLRSLRHENVVHVEGLFSGRYGLRICMQICPDGDVDHYVCKRGAFAESSALELSRQVLGGLNFVHSRRVIHRDLKPANLLLLNDASQAVISDFGSAHQEVDDEGPALSFRGTPDFAAPEIWIGEVWDERVDIWSCGFCIYFMLYGVLPFSMESRKVKKALRNGILPSFEIKSASLLVRDLLRQCLAVNVRDRPPAMELLMHPALELSSPSLTTAPLSMASSLGSSRDTRSLSPASPLSYDDVSKESVSNVRLGLGLGRHRVSAPAVYPWQRLSPHGSGVHARSETAAAWEARPLPSSERHWRASEAEVPWQDLERPQLLQGPQARVLTSSHATCE